MSMRDLERQLIEEVRELTGRKKLRLKDLLEWSTSENVVRGNAAEGEVVVHCPKIGVWACVPEEVS